MTDETKEHAQEQAQAVNAALQGLDTLALDGLRFAQQEIARLKARIVELESAQTEDSKLLAFLRWMACTFPLSMDIWARGYYTTTGITFDCAALRAAKEMI